MAFCFHFPTFSLDFTENYFRTFFYKDCSRFMVTFTLNFAFAASKWKRIALKKKYPIRSWWNQKFRWFDWWRESKCQQFGRTFYSPSRYKLLLVLLSSRTAKHTNEMLNQGNKFSITNYLCVANHHRFKRRNILIYLLDIFLVNLFCAILWTVCL